MSSSLTPSRLGRLAVIAALGIAIAGTAACTGRQSTVKIESSTEVMSTAQDEIRTLTYRTRTTTLMARRTSDARAFAIYVSRSNLPATQHCQTSSNLAGLLPDLVTFAARRQLTRQQVMAEFPVQLGTLVLEHQIPAEPVEPIAVRATQATNAETVAQYSLKGGVAFFGDARAGMVPDGYHDFKPR